MIRFIRDPQPPANQVYRQGMVRALTPAEEAAFIASGDAVDFIEPGRIFPPPVQLLPPGVQPSNPQGGVVVPTANTNQSPAAQGFSPNALALNAAGSLVRASADGLSWSSVSGDGVDWVDRAGGTRVIQWDAGALTMTSNPGESATLVDMEGERWLRVTPSTTAGAVAVARLALTEPVYLGALKTLQIPMMFEDMSDTEFKIDNCSLWLKINGVTGYVKPQLQYFGHWPNRRWVWSWGIGSNLSADLPTTALDTDEVTDIRVVIAAGTSSAPKRPVYFGPIEYNRRGRPLVMLRMDGLYASQHKYLLPLIERMGLRATLYSTTAYMGQAGRMTEAQVSRAYSWGHTIAHHSYQATTQGWSNGTLYPDAASIIADIQANWSHFSARGWTRGIGHTCMGYTTTTMPSVSNARQVLVRGALESAGVKTMSMGGSYTFSALYPTGNLFAYSNPKADWLAMFGGVSIGAATTASAVHAVIDAAIERGELATILMHEAVLDSATPVGSQMRLADYYTWMEYLADRVQAGAVEVLPVDEVYARRPL